MKQNQKQKITLLITAYKEPNISVALNAALNQSTKLPYEVILCAPDKETLEIGKTFQKKHKNLKLMIDPGKGKSYALNIAFSELKTDILILTDGDVFISRSSIEAIMKIFENKNIACVSGQPIPQEDKTTRFGYWSHFLFESADKIRSRAFSQNAFIECSGYLFAFRKNLIDKIPLDVSEDAVIPYMLKLKGYDIGYARDAEVFVKNPTNLKDWLKQKTRTHKAHEKLNLYVDTKKIKKVKSFKTEAKGIFWLIKYPKNIEESFWTIELVFARLYTWIIYFFETKFAKKKYSDGWERVESTK